MNVFVFSYDSILVMGIEFFSLFVLGGFVKFNFECFLFVFIKFNVDFVLSMFIVVYEINVFIVWDFV